MSQTAVGVFESHELAVQAVNELRREGFRGDQISIFAPDPGEEPEYAEELGVSVVQGSAAGAVAGGLIGGISGWLVGLSTLLIPGVGAIVAAGPLAVAAVGVIGGASVGGFIGMLVGLGLPKHAAEEFNRELLAGRTVVIVHTEGLFAKAELAMLRAKPLGLHHYEEEWPSPTATGAGVMAAPGARG